MTLKFARRVASTVLAFFAPAIVIGVAAGVYALADLAVDTFQHTLGLGRTDAVAAATLAVLWVITGTVLARLAWRVSK